MSKAGDILRRMLEADFDDEDMDLLKHRGDEVHPPEKAEHTKFEYPAELRDPNHPIRQAFFGAKKVPPLNGKTAVIYFGRADGSPCVDDLYTGVLTLEPGTTVICKHDDGTTTKGVFISQNSHHVGIAWYGTDINTGGDMPESIAAQLIREADPTNYDRGLGHALGIKMPDDWDETSSLDQLQASMFLVSKTYNTVSWPDEDDGNGPDEEKGFVFSDEPMSWDELMNELHSENYGEFSTYPVSPEYAANVWVSTPDGEENYQTGERTYYSLHINAITSQDNAYQTSFPKQWSRRPTGPEMYAIYRAAGLVK